MERDEGYGHGDEERIWLWLATAMALWLAKQHHTPHTTHHLSRGEVIIITITIACGTEPGT